MATLHDGNIQEGKKAMVPHITVHRYTVSSNILISHTISFVWQQYESYNLNAHFKIASSDH